MNMFRKISLKVHPDINGNTSLNNKRMREVLKYRTNEQMLEELARKWGLEIDGKVYTAPRNFLYFRTVFGKIYMVEKQVINSFRNVKLKATFDDIGWNNFEYLNDESFRRFEVLSLLQNYRFYGGFDILVKNSKVFKMYELIRTTKKCVYVLDDNVKDKRYNMTSVIGRRVKKFEDVGNTFWNWN